VELAVNNVGVAVWTPLNTWLAAMWLFFDQALLQGWRMALSTFLSAVAAGRNGQ
jgi:hypothetical protein